MLECASFAYLRSLQFSVNYCPRCSREFAGKRVSVRIVRFGHVGQRKASEECCEVYYLQCARRIVREKASLCGAAFTAPAKRCKVDRKT